MQKILQDILMFNIVQNFEILLLSIGSTYYERNKQSFTVYEIYEALH